MILKFVYICVVAPVESFFDRSIADAESAMKAAAGAVGAVVEEGDNIVCRPANIDYFTIINIQLKYVYNLPCGTYSIGGEFGVDLEMVTDVMGVMLLSTMWLMGQQKMWS